MKALAFLLWRIKARNQTLYLMRRYRVWYIDNPRAATVDRWWRQPGSATLGAAEVMTGREARTGTRAVLAAPVSTPGYF